MRIEATSCLFTSLAWPEPCSFLKCKTDFWKYYLLPRNIHLFPVRLSATAEPCSLLIRYYMNVFLESYKFRWVVVLTSTHCRGKISVNESVVFLNFCHLWFISRLKCACNVHRSSFSLAALNDASKLPKNKTINCILKVLKISSPIVASSLFPRISWAMLHTLKEYCKSAEAFVINHFISPSVKSRITSIAGIKGSLIYCF